MDPSLPTPPVALGHPYRLLQAAQCCLDSACSQGHLWVWCLCRVIARLVGTAGWTAGKGLWQCPMGSPGCMPLGGGKAVGRLWGLQNVRPGLICRKIQLIVLSESSIHFLAFLDKDRAKPAPTRVSLYPTGYASQPRPRCASCRPVSAHTGSTCVLHKPAVIG